MAPTVELWVDDHQEYEPGIVTGNLRHARLPLDPHPGDYLVVGDDEVPPALALVVSRDPDGTLVFGSCRESLLGTGFHTRRGPHLT